MRTNRHFTLKTSPLKREDLDEFVECYKPGKRHERVPIWAPVDPDSGAAMTKGEAGMTGDDTGAAGNGVRATGNGRWRAYDYDELIARDKVSLDIFWLRDDSLADTDNLPPPGVIAAEIVEDLEAALEQMRLIAEDLTVDLEREEAPS